MLFTMAYFPGVVCRSVLEPPPQQFASATSQVASSNPHPLHSLQPTLRRSEAPAKRSRVYPGDQPHSPAEARLRPCQGRMSTVCPAPGPGLGLRSPPLPTAAPPPGSLYASATTEKNRCWHLRKDLPPEIRLSLSCHYLSLFKLLSAVWRILSHWEWVPSYNVRKTDSLPPLPLDVPGSLLPARSVYDRGSPRRGGRTVIP